jgi:hypothetical protein
MIKGINEIITSEHTHIAYIENLMVRMEVEWQFLNGVAFENYGNF